MPILHYAIETGGILGSIEVGPVCGHNFHGRKKLTEDWREVTCPTCRKLCGFDEQPVAVDQPATRLAA